MVRETRVQSQVESYQRLKKWYLIPPCLTLSIIRYVLRVKWSNPGEGVAPYPTLWCRSYWKGSHRVSLDYGHQLYLLYDDIVASIEEDVKNSNYHFIINSTYLYLYRLSPWSGWSGFLPSKYSLKKILWNLIEERVPSPTRKKPSVCCRFSTDALTEWPEAAGCWNRHLLDFHQNPFSWVPDQSAFTPL